MVGEVVNFRQTCSDTVVEAGDPAMCCFMIARAARRRRVGCEEEVDMKAANDCIARLQDLQPNPLLVQTAVGGK